MLAHEMFQYGQEEIVSTDQREFFFKKGKPLKAEFNWFATGTWMSLEIRPAFLHSNGVTRHDMHNMPVLDLASSEFSHRIEVVTEDANNFCILDATFLS